MVRVHRRSTISPCAGVAAAGQPEPVSGAVADEQAPWMVVNAHPHKEALAITNLTQQDFTTYCPMMRRTIRHARRTREVLRPLFPGYIFVRADGQIGSWRPIHSTIGVRRVIAWGDVPGTVEAGFIAELKAREMEGAIVLPANPYRVGQQVRLRASAFDGIIATILDIDEKGRITVLMDMLSQSVRVQTSVHGIREA